MGGIKELMKDLLNMSELLVASSMLNELGVTYVTGLYDMPRIEGIGYVIGSLNKNVYKVEVSVVKMAATHLPQRCLVWSMLPYIKVLYLVEFGKLLGQLMA